MNRKHAVRRAIDKLLACPVHEMVLPKSLYCTKCGRQYEQPAPAPEQEAVTAA
jgi:hypothetical protein